MCLLGSGKSTFLKKLVTDRHDVIAGEDFKKIMYLYKCNSPQTKRLIDEMRKAFPGLVYHQGMKSIATNPDLGDTLVIMDDLQKEASSNV